MSKQLNGSRHRFAVIDDKPTTTGIYGTDPVNFFDHQPPYSTVIFTLRDGGGGVPFSGTVTLQYKASKDPGWTDHETYSSIGDREEIKVGGNMEWRAVVKEDADYTEGIGRFGFNW